MSKRDCKTKATKYSIKKLQKMCHACKKKLFTLTTSPMIVDPHTGNSTAMPETDRNNSDKQVVGSNDVTAYPKNCF